MPLPAGVFSGQPLLETKEVELAVEKAFETVGLIAPRDRAQRALDSAGMNIEELSLHLVNLIHTSKDSTKLKAILNAFEMQGVATKLDQGTASAPSINFHVHSDNGTVNLQNLFNPER